MNSQQKALISAMTEAMEGMEPEESPGFRFLVDLKMHFDVAGAGSHFGEIMEHSKLSISSYEASPEWRRFMLAYARSVAAMLLAAHQNGIPYKAMVKQMALTLEM